MNKQIKKLMKKHNAKNLKELSNKTNISYSIIKNWSSGKTSIKSIGKYNKVKIPKEKNGKIAELVGIILGDGSLDRKKLRIFSNKEEAEYLNYVKSLIYKIFDIEAKTYESKINKGTNLIINSVLISGYLRSIGLVMGNKIKNNASFPQWIFTNETYLKSCLRGIFDTDGSFFVSGKNPNILWKMGYGSRLPVDIRKSLILLNFNPTKIFDDGKKVGLCRKKEINRFFKEIKPQNKVKIERYLKYIK